MISVIFAAGSWGKKSLAAERTKKQDFFYCNYSFLPWEPATISRLIMAKR